MQDTIYISGLEPLIASEKVASWPLAPGWYIVTGLLLLALLLLVFSWIRKRRANRYRIVALEQLMEIRTSAAYQPAQGDIQSLNRLLKETALTVYSREQVAGLFGEEWLEFLDQSCSRSNFTDLPGKLLDNTAYLDMDQLNILKDQWSQLLVEVETWINTHIKPKN